jgi:hypothetical protein
MNKGEVKWVGKSLLGKTVGDLAILRPDKTSNYKRWICKCNACGSVMSLSSSQISRGNCGCVSTRTKVTRETLFDLYVNKQMNISEIAKETGVHRNTVSNYICKYRLKKERTNVIKRDTKQRQRTGPKPHKLINRKIGNLTVDHYIDINTVVCKCDCGNEITVPTAKLFNYEVLSCGCSRSSEEARDDVIEITWNKIVRNGYSDQWGGIESFIKWSKDNGYKRGMILSTIKSDELTPDNCMWVEQETTIIRSNNIIVDIGSTTRSLSEWVQYLDLNYAHVYKRYKNGYRGKELFL